MVNWVNVVSEASLANGEHVVVNIDGINVAVFKINGTFYAIEDVCPHDGTEIATGSLDGTEIICPRHGAKFCLKSGTVKSAPAYENIMSIPVRIYNGMVQVNDDDFN